MPVVSTEVLETLKGLGLDEARALRAAAAVGEARTEADRRALGEVVTMRGQLEALRAAVDADLAAMRADLAASLEAATAAQRETAQTMAQTLKAETEGLRRAVAAAEAARAEAEARTANALRMLQALLIAVIGLTTLGLLAAIFV
jgi:Skp family chaperone for outer membrane proteins